MVVVEVQQVEMVGGYCEQWPPLQDGLARDRQRLGQHRDRAPVKQKVVVGAEAEDVVKGVPTEVGSPEWPDVRRLGVRSDRGGEDDPAQLAREVVEPLH